MNIDLYVSILNAKFIQKHTKKILGIGAYLCLSASSMTALAASQNEYKGNAQMLIAANAQTLSSYPSQDIQSLREQLIEKTKELEEYKACLFRPSHPQDQAKINDLTRQIGELEKNRQALIAQANSHKAEMAEIKKQKDTLEVSSEALTDYIKTQRALVEEEKQGFIAKILAYEEETELERRNNETLIEELAALKDKLFSLEKLVVHYENNEDLQDALLEASMLKFELDDTRLQAEQKEKELIVSTLNYLTMAHDHIGTLKTKQEFLKGKLDASKIKYADLLAFIDEVESENTRLQQERRHLEEKNDTDGKTLQQYTVQRHVFANKLMESEESLNAALLYYETTLGDLALLVESLQTLLAKEEAAKLNIFINNEYLLQHNDTLQNAVSGSSEAMAETSTTHQLAINDYLQQLHMLEEKLAAEEDLRSQLQNEKESFIEQEGVRQREAEEHVIALSYVKEQLSKYETDLASSQASIDENAKQIDELKEKLAAAETEHATLKQAYDALSSKNDDAEQKLQIYAEDLDSSQGSIDENAKQIDELKEKLAAAEAEHTSLKQAYDALSAKNDDAEQKLQHYEEELNSSQGSIDENAKHIDELTEQLAAAETEHASLKQAYDALSAKNDDAEQKLQHYEEDLHSSQGSIDENAKHIGELTEKLAAAEAEHASLKQAYDALSAKNDDAEQKLQHYEEDLHSSQGSIDENAKHIDELTEKLAAAEAEHTSLKQAYDTLSAKNDNAEQQLQHYAEHLTSSQNAIEEHLSQLKNLQEQIAAAEAEYLILLETHEDLSTKNAHNENQLLSTEASIAEHLKQIDALQEKLTAAETDRLFLKQAHDDQIAKNSKNQHLLSDYENELVSSKESLAEKMKFIDELKDKLAAAEAMHLSQEQSHENATTAKEWEIKQSQENLASAHDQLNQLAAKLEHKEAEHAAAAYQLQQLQASKDQLHESLNQTLQELENSQTQLNHEIYQSAHKSHEWDLHQQEHSRTANQLKNQIEDQIALIEKLNQEIIQLYADQIEHDSKEAELEHAIQSLTTVAERQDHSLADANSAFAMVQAYNQQLETENRELRNRINHLELAERSETKPRSSNEQDLIPPALFKLLKP
jgi:chromosome segregation ATPase